MEIRQDNTTISQILDFLCDQHGIQRVAGLEMGRLEKRSPGCHYSNLNPLFESIRMHGSIFFRTIRQLQYGQDSRESSK